MKKFLKWIGIAVLILILIQLLFDAVILGWGKFTGIKEWAQVKKDLRAKGEKLTFLELAPSDLPDTENFFADPMWQQLADLVPHSENVITEWIPRIGKKDQLVNRWETPLTESELANYKSIFPEGNYSISLSRKDAIKQLALSLNKTSGVDGEKIAKLILDLEIPATPFLNRISDLLKRKSSYFPLRYQDNYYTPLPHCAPLLTIGQLLGAKASSELSLGQSEAAALDIEALLKLSRVLDNEPILICMLVGKAIHKIGIELLNKGIFNHLWNDSELLNFQERLQPIDLIKQLAHPLRGERACIDEASLINISEIINLEVKTGIVLQIVQYFFQEHQKAFSDKRIQEWIDLIILNYPGGVNSSSMPPIFTTNGYSQDIVGRLLYIKSFAFLLAQAVIKNATQGITETQTQINQTIIACALERYRIAHGSYPASLDALIPDYLTFIPKEPTTGQPMHYKLLDTGEFLIWAPGWNLQTLDGKPGEYRGDGDIVWNQNIPTQERPASARH